MRLSRWTIVAPVPGRDTTLLIQPLSGEAALLANAKAEALTRQPLVLPPGVDEEALRRGRLVVDSDEDDKRLGAEAAAAFVSETERTPTQLVVVPGFGCNLKCTYCYQEPFDPAAGLVSPEVIDAFFAWVDRFHAGEEPRPYVTLFGGEPLVDTPAHRDRVQRYLEGARARGMGVAVVTNGYDLESYAGLLAQGPLREVQVTLDGPPAVHDARRPHGRGGGTFDRVVRGIEALVAAKVPINLRVVVDRANLPALPELARFVEARGWLDLPHERFKTQVGRNYELFGCAAGQNRADLLGRAELWASYLDLAEREPVLRRFYRPRFHGMGHLAETGELPAANFDTCPATKKEWAFGPDGSLYGCTATVGNPRYRLGSYHPEVRRDEAAIAQWSGRSTFRIAECKDCNLAPVCGGGCGALAAARTGSPMSPDCRPVRELMGLGARFYGLDQLDPEPETPAAKTPEPDPHAHGGHGEPVAQAGCLACGADLVYLERAEPMPCAGCGVQQESRARCTAGHFFCDRCHAGSGVDAIEQVLLRSEERDPVALAVAAMRHPKVKMHGPEHHFLAPAALVAAWCNVRGEAHRKEALLAEVRRRSEPVCGGFCGFQGACGAAVGTGIFVSLVTGATPLSTSARGQSMRVTSEALQVLAGLDAPRCCKRDTFLSLLSAARFARAHLGVELPARGPTCEFHTRNRECLGARCPFYPKRAKGPASQPA